MAGTDEELVLAAARLSRNAPELWEQFIGAFRAYTERSVTNCIQSPVSELTRAQGRAQSASYLYGLMSSCRETADHIERKRR